MSETVATGLTLQEATNWLWIKASEISGWVSPDLIAKVRDGDESWAAVPAD